MTLERQAAHRILNHYFSQLHKAAGLTWNYDNYVEIKELVGAIIDAAKAEIREELPAIIGELVNDAINDPDADTFAEALTALRNIKNFELIPAQPPSIIDAAKANASTLDEAITSLAADAHLESQYEDRTDSPE